MSERKYRQRGYMDSDRDSRRGREEPKPKQQPQQRDREGPRSPRMMAYGEKVKCSSCSAVVPQTSAPTVRVRSATQTCTPAAMHLFRSRFTF